MLTSSISYFHFLNADNSDFLRREGNAGERPKKPDIPNYALETRSKTVYKEKQRKKVHKGIGSGEGNSKRQDGLSIESQPELKPGEREQVMNGYNHTLSCGNATLHEASSVNWSVRRSINDHLVKNLIVAKALDGQRYPLPLCKYMWVYDSERGSGPEGANDLCLVIYEAPGLNLSINNGI